MSDREKANLLGAVRIVHLEAAELSVEPGGRIEGPRVPSRTVIYNGDGNIVKEAVYSVDGNPSQVTFIRYNVGGRRKEEACYKADGGLVSRTDYEYDEEGRETGATRLLTHGLVTRLKGVPAYDGRGHKIEESWHYEDGSPHHKYVFTYGDDGGLAEQAVYTYADDGALEEKRVSIYGEAGHVREVVSLNADGQVLEGKYTYDYDERGNETEAVSYTPDGSPFRKSVFSYELDSVGNWIKQIERRHIIATGLETILVAHRILAYQ